MSQGNHRAGPPPAAGERVELYTWAYCSYCMAAKRLLQKKGVAFKEYHIEGDETARAAMMARAGGRRSVPQIFIDGMSIGGYMELYQLEQSGRLDELLAAPPQG